MSSQRRTDHADSLFWKRSRFHQGSTPAVKEKERAAGGDQNRFLMGPSIGYACAAAEEGQQTGAGVAATTTSIPRRVREFVCGGCRPLDLKVL